MCKPENATLTQATVLGMMTTGMQTALNIAKQLAIFAALLAALFLGQSPAQAASEPSVPPHEGDFVIHNFHFESGETLPHVKMHYTTFGAPKRDASGPHHECCSDSSWHQRWRAPIPASHTESS
jgi:hypothetical protein